MSKYKLVINLKTYKESTNLNAIKIAKAVLELSEQAKKKNVEIVLCPQLTDVKEISKLGVSVYSQHVDYQDHGANTGYVIPETLKSISVKGSLISHSEHLLSFNEIRKRVQKLKQLKMVSCVCARDVAAVKKLVSLQPGYIAVEPQDLIGGDISVSTAKPDLIEKSVKAAGDIPLLVGAGVKNSNDVRKSLELGARGILVASGVVKVKSPKASIKDLLDGF